MLGWSGSTVYPVTAWTWALCAWQARGCDVCSSILNSQAYVPAAAGVAGLDAAANAGLKLTAHALVGLACQLGLRLATFSLGPASRLLGAETHKRSAYGGPQQCLFSYCQPACSRWSMLHCQAALNHEPQNLRCHNPAPFCPYRRR